MPDEDKTVALSFENLITSRAHTLFADILPSQS